jgi:L-asparaginase II
LANPVLIEIVRGTLVESRHRGAVAVWDSSGRALLVLGDTSAPVFPRSAVKVMQAIPLILTGAAESFGFGNRELALACSSHSGEPRHVALAASMLARAGLDASALECGAHAPSQDRASRELILAGARPTPLHNNCSGKHAGMLAVARHLGEVTRGYVKADHPVQLRIARIMADLTGASPLSEVCGVDGCSVPTWALPLAGWAHGFAQLAKLSPDNETAKAGRRLMAACMAEPYFVAGEKRFCTDVMAAADRAIFVKTGAEGVFCGAIPGKGIGIALKIDDGATRASEAAIAGLLDALVPGHSELFARWVQKPIRNVAGAVVGEVRLESGFAAACQRLCP